MSHSNNIGFDQLAKYRDDGLLNRPPFALGTKMFGRDGHDWIFGRATAAITANTASVLTEPAMTFAAGAGAWTSPAFALVLNDYAWFRKTAA
jgi:hypothetical protein